MNGMDEWRGRIVSVSREGEERGRAERMNRDDEQRRCIEQQSTGSTLRMKCKDKWRMHRG
jgi:hypothetical protein